MLSREPQDDYLAFMDRLQGDHAREDWRIEDDGRADYALRKIGALESSKAKRAAYVAAEIERLQAWQSHEDQQDQRGIDFFTSHLSRYADQLVADGVLHAKRKSYKLPHGTLQFRAKAITFARNAEELLPWAVALGLIRTKTEVDWEAVKARLVIAIEVTAIGERHTVIDQGTGEVVPGVTVESPAHDEFSVKTSMD